MQTPLHDEHVRLGARMVPFAGWDMPVQYRGILAEHEATRTACTVFDTCHMGEFEVSGPTAEADLETLLTMRVATIREGQCRYGFMLNEEGGTLDDLTCYRLGPERFWLIVNAGTRPADAEWIRSRVSAGTRFRDRSDELAKLDVQGPASLRVTQAALGIRLPELKYFRFEEITIAGAAGLISRTGYTGEWGYELYFAADRAVDIWRDLLRAGAQPAGLGARDTLRMEMGYSLYGHELGADRTPVETCGGAFIDLSKSFIGRSKVEEELRQGSPMKLAGLRLEFRRAARAGDIVRCDGGSGVVASGSFSPSLGVAIALARVPSAAASAGTRVTLESRDATLAAELVDLPFWRQGTARATMPPVT